MPECQTPVDDDLANGCHEGVPDGTWKRQGIFPAFALLRNVLIRMRNLTEQIGFVWECINRFFIAFYMQIYIRYYNVDLNQTGKNIQCVIIEIMILS